MATRKLLLRWKREQTRRNVLQRLQPEAGSTRGGTSRGGGGTNGCGGSPPHPRLRQGYGGQANPLPRERGRGKDNDSMLDLPLPLAHGRERIEVMVGLYAKDMGIFRYGI